MSYSIPGRTPEQELLGDMATADVPSTTSIAGRVVVVTGSGQGIGRVLASRFAEAAASVVIADRDAAAAEAVAEDLRRRSLSAFAVGVDVADDVSADKMVRATLAAFGRVDVLVNNAAVFSTIEMKPFDQLSTDEWRRVIDVNLTGVFNCCRAVAAPMRQQRRGRIINMSSATALFGRPNYLHYVASKAGVIGITRGLARELGPYGVTVNSVLPGSVDTGISRDTVSAEQAASIVATQAISRRLVPEDLAGIALFLASDASEAITGQSLVADGGANFV